MVSKKISRKVYTADFKLSVIKDYYLNNHSLRSIVRKYDLSCNSTILSWLKKYPISDSSLSLSDEVINRFMKKKQDDSRELTKEENLSAEVERLKKALFYSELRNEALTEVIKIGKEEFGIDLLKKAGAKQ